MALDDAGIGGSPGSDNTSSDTSDDPPGNTDDDTSFADTPDIGNPDSPTGTPDAGGIAPPPSDGDDSGSTDDTPRDSGTTGGTDDSTDSSTGSGGSTGSDNVGDPDEPAGTPDSGGIAPPPEDTTGGTETGNTTPDTGDSTDSPDTGSDVGDPSAPAGTPDSGGIAPPPEESSTPTQPPDANVPVGDPGGQTATPGSGGLAPAPENPDTRGIGSGSPSSGGFGGGSQSERADFLEEYGDETTTTQAEEFETVDQQSSVTTTPQSFGNRGLTPGESITNIAAGLTLVNSGARINTDVTDRLTSGGLLSEGTESDLRGLSQGYSSFTGGLARGAGDLTEGGLDVVTAPFGKTGDQVAGTSGRVVKGATNAIAQVGNVPSHISAAETGIEVVTKAPGEVQAGNAGEIAESATALTGLAAESAASAAINRPAETAGSVLGGFLAGAGVSRGAGRLARGARDRVRTVGGEKVDIEDITQESVAKEIENPTGDPDTQFPGASDPDTYRDNPAEAVTDQAQSKTPDTVTDFFENQGADDGVVLKKALDTEPEGPDSARASQGLSVPADVADAYESPGSFVGPELSPNFLRLGGGRGRISLRPGLPDTGGKPTGVLAKTDVENTRGSSLDEFNDDLVDRTGDTTAIAKPASDINVGEVEAVLPPGAEFTDVGTGGIRGTLRSAGIGSDFYTEVGGRRVPLRTVAPDGETDGAPRVDVDLDDTSSTGGTGSTLDDITEPVSEPVDRTTPLTPSQSPTSSGPPASPGGGGGGSDLPGSRPPDSEPASPSSPPSTPGSDDTVLTPGPSTGNSGSPPSDLPTTGGFGGSPGFSGEPTAPGSPGGGSSIGSPSGPGSPGSSGTPSSPAAFDPPTRRRPRDIDLDLDIGSDRKKKPEEFTVASDEVVTQFRDPLSGDILTEDLPGGD